MMTVETPCREWRGARTSDGYGHKWIPEWKKAVRVHRWVVAQIHGWDAIKGKEVMHLCDNPACYRYDHLRIGTHADNMADMYDKNRRQAVFGSSHGRTHLAESDVLEIRASTDRQVDIARRYGISRSQVSNIRTRKTWRHI